MKEWHFNVLFFTGIGGAVLLLIGPDFGLKVADNPQAFMGIGLILTYVLTQKKTWVQDKADKKNGEHKKEVEGNGD